MTRVYFRDAHACVVMFDLTRRESFLNVAKWKYDVDSKVAQPDGATVPCLLLANKVNLTQGLALRHYENWDAGRRVVTIFLSCL